VFSHWKSELIGGVLIGALALYSDLTGTPVPPRLYEIAAGIVLLWAMFLAWQDEHDGRLKAEIETARVTVDFGKERAALDAQLAAKRPNLTCKIESCDQLMTFLGQEEGYGTNIVFMVSIRNSGARTALSDWKLEIPGVITEPADPRDDPSQAMLLKSNKFDDLVSVSQAGIGSGDIINGVLIFLVPNLTNEIFDDPATRFILSFTDAHGETHVAEADKPVRRRQKA